MSYEQVRDALNEMVTVIRMCEEEARLLPQEPNRVFVADLRAKQAAVFEHCDVDRILDDTFVMDSLLYEVRETCCLVWEGRAVTATSRNQQRSLRLEPVGADVHAVYSNAL